SGTWTTGKPAEPFQSADRWSWADLCPAYRSADYPSVRHIAAIDTVSFHAQPRYLHELLHRYEPGWGARAVNDVRNVVLACAGTGPPVPPGAPALARRTIVDSWFAGDESLLVRED